MFRIIFLALILAGTLVGCKNSSDPSSIATKDLKIGSPDQVKKIIEQFILAEDSTVIELPTGHFEFETQLIIDNLQGLTIKGKGMDKTVLSFKGLKAGGEGVKIVGNDILLEDFSVYDAPGDGIKTQNCNGITFRRINATWTNGDKSKNGTYALYPVQCTNVLIEESHASHSRDAGIYVGQSENIIVRNCEAYGNVAGIEIENCSNAEVYDNKVYDNAGGILVFNLPNLPKADGARTRVYNNEVLENNHKNFAIPLNESPNGNTVTMIPPGSGIILLAAKEVEIFGNKILDNKTVGVAVANYHITGFPSEAPDWSPFSSDISIHDNEYKRPLAPPDLSKDLGKLIAAKNAHGIGKTQDIIYDGFWDKSKGAELSSNPMNICIQEKGIEDLHFTLYDLYGGEDDIKAFSDYNPFVCDYTVQTDVEELKTL
ncbi:MAG: hypothetical protein HKN16_07080 [Saprospiraceae bacterium]|nr:hypothetical protein [Saprospiraceae bacterium]